VIVKIVARPDSFPETAPARSRVKAMGKDSRGRVTSVESRIIPQGNPPRR
jgi:hypothetical protein